jgi:dTDP-4-dehydrorhamnose 3,5-epimerase
LAIIVRPASFELGEKIMTDSAEPDPLSWMGAEFRDRVATQSYEEQPGIDGVALFDLQLLGDEGGDFCEVGRYNAHGELEAAPGFRPAQCGYSFMEPGTIKAWHLHVRQEDLWFIPPHDRCLVGLLDVREKSTTYQCRMRFVMGGGRARLLLIPRGVAHGIANLSNRPASMFYFVNEAFNRDNPDEQRLPWDLLGEDFWRNVPG